MRVFAVIYEYGSDGEGYEAFFTSEEKALEYMNVWCRPLEEGGAVRSEEILIDPDLPVLPDGRPYVLYARGGNIEGSEIASPEMVLRGNWGDGKKIGPGPYGNVQYHVLARNFLHAKEIVAEREKR